MKIISKLGIRLSVFFLVPLLILPGCATENESGCGREFIPGPLGIHFDAIVDGNEWFPQEEFNFGPGPIQLSYELLHSGSVTYHYFDVSVYRDTCPRSNLVIHCDSFYGVGSYKLTGTSTISWAAFAENSHHFFTDSLHTGLLQITQVDTNKKLLSGTVSFDAAEGTSVVSLRSGTFTFNY